MMLAYDGRAALGGKPGLHVLIVGVSGYRHLPKRTENPLPQTCMLRQLSSAATSAYKVYDWLLTHQQSLPLPLATCRLLLSPSEEETLAVQPGASPATRQAFETAAQGWRADARSHRDNLTLFYFAGHGVQRSRDDTVLLLEDFAEPSQTILARCVELQNIYQGMAPGPLGGPIASQQVYFVDACRVLPSAFMSFEKLMVPDVFDVELPDVDDRSAPIFHSTLPGTISHALVNEESLFCRALLAALSGRAAMPEDDTDAQGNPQWVVSAHSLNKALGKHFALLTNLDPKGLPAQTVTMGGQLLGDLPLHRLNGPPPVDLMLEVDPQAAVPFTRVSVVDSLGQALPDLPLPLEPHPHSTQVLAGIYTVAADIEPPNPLFVNWPKRQLLFLPPRYSCRLRVQP